MFNALADEGNGSCIIADDHNNLCILVRVIRTSDRFTIHIALDRRVFFPLDDTLGYNGIIGYFEQIKQINL